jgi:hypothetical protein
MIDTRSRCRIVNHQGLVVTIVRRYVPEENQTVLLTLLDPRELLGHFIPADEIYITHTEEGQMTSEEWSEYCSPEAVAERIDDVLVEVLKQLNQLH